jgi:aspartyl/glutamyl-tRNA(Asn/Gln) amidotransferase C subunit
MTIKTDMCPETKAKVLKYSILAKLIHRNCTEDEVDQYLSFFNEKNFNDVIDMIKTLENIDTEGIPEQFAFFDDEEHRNTHDDVISDGEIRDIVMSNAQSQAGYFVVPAVIEDKPDNE